MATTKAAPKSTATKATPKTKAPKVAVKPADTRFQQARRFLLSASAGF